MKHAALVFTLALGAVIRVGMLGVEAMADAGGMEVNEPEVGRERIGGARDLPQEMLLLPADKIRT